MVLTSHWFMIKKFKPSRDKVDIHVVIFLATTDIHIDRQNIDTDRTERRNDLEQTHSPFVWRVLHARPALWQNPTPVFFSCKFAG